MIKAGKQGAILFSLYGSKVRADGILEAGLVEDRIYPENSGSLTKLKGCSYLYKGYPNGMILRFLEVSKDAGWMLGAIFKNRALMILGILTYFFFRKIAVKNFVRISNAYLKIAYDPMKRADIIPQPHEWCKSVKEFYRMSEILLKDIVNGEIKGIFSKLRDIALMIPEQDTAYRFVVQDILPEINLEELKKSPKKEMSRLMDMLIRREHPGDQRNKWIKVKKLVMLALKIRKLRKLCVKFLLGLDYEQIKLDEADWYFVLGHHCYDYQDVSYEDRITERRAIDDKKNHKIPRMKLIMEPNPHIETVEGYGL